MSDKITVDADDLRNVCRSLSSMIEVLDPGPPIAEVSQPNGEPAPTAADVMLDEAGRFGDPPFGRPVGISRDERDRDEPGQPEGSRRPSVVDRGSDEIELRWAKETIGLVAVVLNEAYAEFDITNFTTGQIPSGKLYQASRQLEEAMQRLGLTDHLTDDLSF